MHFFLKKRVRQLVDMGTFLGVGTFAGGGGGGGNLLGEGKFSWGGNSRAPLLLYKTQWMIIYLVLKHKEGIQQHREEQVRNPDKKKVRVYTRQ